MQSADPVMLCQQLIQKASVTPIDAGCQDLIADFLARLGYKRHSFDQEGITNSYYCRPEGDPQLWYVGHTDVVPTGDETQWSYPPFSATIANDHLYGRGAVDMKGGIACFLTALQLATHKLPKLNVGILITSDEEGPARYGIKAMIQAIKEKNYCIPAYCLVGEPSSKSHVGDTVKIGRRGSLSAHITVKGKQGHVAYPHLALNPIHACIEALNQMTQHSWDQGNEHFDPTQCQLVSIESDTRTSNVIPNQVNITLNFRYSPETDANTLKHLTETIFQEHSAQKYGTAVTIDWHHSGKPFYTPAGKLVKAMVDAISKIQHKEPILSTSGGTSDGRFIAPLGCEVIEMGLINKTIHQINEHTSLTDLHTLTALYEQFLFNLHGS